MERKFGLMYLLFCFMLVACTSQKNIATKLSPKEAFVSNLLSQMTLEEKVGQMTQYNGFFDVTGPAPTDGDAKIKYEHVKSGLVGSMLNVRGADQVRAMQKLAIENSRLGIPMIFGFDVIHGFKTTMPIPLAESASWDLEAIEQSARISAVEAASAGINWTFAPMVDISRDARWGRVMEGAGEDPFLGSEIARARVRGFQGDNLADTSTIVACAKHFAAYGFAESGKDYNTADVGTSTLYNVILPPFKAAAEAGVGTFMNSFNELNGIPATGDKFLQREVLKSQWGFDGFIVSDWGSISEMKDHGFAKDGKDAARIAVNAGSDMDMESHLYPKHLKFLVEEAKVSQENIDDAVRRILGVKYDLGLFEDPYKYCNPDRESHVTLSDAHRNTALDMAKKSIVLLKNKNNLLPLPKEGKKIAVIGHLASEKNSPLGNWRLAADEQSAVSVLEGLEKYDGNSYDSARGVSLFSGREHFVFELDINTTDSSGMEEAISVAKQSDIVIMVLGEHGLQSGEGRSRSSLGLPGLQQQMLEKVYAANPNIVLVLMNGRPLAIEWADEHIPAIVEAWHLGIESGNAIAQVLYGDHNPSGKLPMTFPRSVGQVPIYYNYKMTGRPGPKHEVFWSHFIDKTNAPLYEFGHGLSYTEFEYSDFKLVKNEDGNITASILLTNTGTRDGEEVVQLYIRDLVASVTRPVKELKAFEKVFLTPNESKEITFQLGAKQLGFYDNQGKFVTEAGEFKIMIEEHEETIYFEKP